MRAALQAALTASKAVGASDASTRNQCPAPLGSSLQPATSPISSQRFIVESKTDASSAPAIAYREPMAPEPPSNPGELRPSAGHRRVESRKSRLPFGRLTSVSLLKKS